MTEVLTGGIDCPMCEWEVYTVPPSQRVAEALYEEHIDYHCDLFAEQMDLILPGVG